MSKKLELKIDDGTFFTCKVPRDTEELVLDCKVIGEKAFWEFSSLTSITFLNTEVIADDAFYNCCNLCEVHLPDSLKVIGNNAFKRTALEHLTIPPGVVKLGKDFVLNDDHHYVDVEIFLPNEKTIPFFDGSVQRVEKVKITARSAQTKEKLAEFIPFYSLEEVLTGHGIDFTEYDKNFKGLDKISSAERWGDTWIVNSHMPLEIPHLRIKYPIGMSAQEAEELKASFSTAAANELEAIINGCVFLGSAKDFRYYDDIDVKNISKLTMLAIEKQNSEAADRLIKTLYKKTDEIENIDNYILEAAINYSVTHGFTEITAAFMQKFHERKPDSGCDPA